MKKWLVCILAFVVMAGVFIPCCPTDGCLEETEHRDSSEGPFQEKGVCSPFFACASCPGFVQMARQVNVPALFKNSITHQEHIISFSVSTYHDSFFQPPRFS